MNKVLFAAILIILCGTLLFGCTKTPPKDNNKLITDSNYTAGTVCADKNKKMVITQIPQGEIWECV